MSNAENKVITEGREIVFKIENNMEKLEDMGEDINKYILKINYKTLHKLLRYIDLLEKRRTGYGG